MSSRFQVSSSGRLSRLILRIVVLAMMGMGAAGSAGAAQGFAGLSRQGPSGLILIPTGSVIQADRYAAGLHRGVIKAGYGVLGVAEIGVTLPDVFDSPGSEEWENRMTGFFKVGGRPLPSAAWAPAVAAGAENSPKTSAETYFVAGNWHWRLLEWGFEAAVGAGTGRFGNRMFGGVGVIPHPFLGNVMKLLVEYAGEEAIAGTRLALSRELRLDFAMRMDARRIDDGGTRRWSVRMDQGMLGASLAGEIEWRKIWDSVTLRKKKKKAKEPAAEAAPVRADDEEE